MKPAPFDYAAPTTLDEAIELLASNPEAKVLAGGQSLMPLLALRLARPELVVDLNRIAGLSGIEATSNPGDAGRSVRFGALVRQRELVTQPHHPLIAEAASRVAHAAIRSRGTFGGSLAHADSAAELPVVSLSIGARIEAVGPNGARTIVVDDFFHGLLQTALADDEVITAIDCPLPQRWGFAELARRQGDFALVLVAVAEFDGQWRIVVGGVEGTPRRCTQAEELATAGPLGPDAIHGIASAAGLEIEASDHLHATASYQRGMATELVQRAMREALIR
jgi:aerobic carbon-monoxide dehydrogenase medium subunit